MKEHSNNFETEIKTYGRQQAVQVIFEQDGQQVVLDNENVFSVTPNFKASLLKSAMKSLILDCNVEIPVGTRLQFKYGILVNNAYEYLNFGYYIVNKIEKKEDARSYEITCYDKMMLAMVDYINLEISYPITIRNYIAEICNYLEIDFGSNQDQFVNYDKQIPSELYLDENGNSLEYTFRDVLDELSQVTASIICIDENDQLVVKYPQRNGDYETIEGTSLYIENADDSKIDLELEGQTSQDGTPAPSSPIPVNNVTGLQKFVVGGDNYFDLKKLHLYATNNLTYSIEDSGNIEVAGDGTSGGYKCIIFDLVLPNGNYTFSCNIEDTDTILGNVGVGIDVFQKESTTRETWREIWITPEQIESGTRRSNTVTIDNLTHYYRLKFYINQSASVSGSESNIVHFQNIMFAKGTDTEYKEYQSKEYEINLGKNLLVNNSPTQTLNGVTYTVNDDKSITLNGTSTQGFVVELTNSLVLDKGIYNLSLKGKIQGCGIYAYIGGGTLKTYVSSNNTADNYQTSFVLDSRTTFTQIRIDIQANKTFNNLTIYPMIERGLIATSYSQYFEPIELNKIGDYQDFIRKGTGKNLLNTNKMLYGTISQTDGITISDNSSVLYSPQYIEVKPNTRYTLSCKVSNITIRLFNYEDDKTYINTSIASTSNMTTSFTTSSNTYFIRLQYNQSFNVDMQLEEGSFTYYEPYNYGGKWYIEKNIGKIIVNGSENCSRQVLSNDIVRFMFTGNVDGIGGARQTIFSNYFVANLNSANDREGIGFVYGNLLYLYKQEASVADFQAWLSTHNTIVYYVLSSPTFEIIDKDDLIEQLERVHLEQGLNNVSIVTYNEQPVLKMSYVSNLIEIDEEQLKDINVNFGEKYGPINSVVIARAADSDFIYKEDDQSVAENGLCEVKISDNQILNDDNRTQFLDGIYYQLKGTEFYLNDFSSTGIVYLDLLDYYKVKVFDNYYKCLMLNDEIDITQGLQEQVFTERPKESETEYKSIAKQDKDIRKLGIIVNKVEGEITAEIIARQDTDEKVSNLTQTIGEISTTVSTTTTQVNDLETRVQTNETSISQNSDSITATISRIQQTEDDVETLETNTEDVIKQLVFGDDGLTISAKGTTSDDMKLNLTNDAIKFLYQNNAVLTINGSTIEFSNASFKKLDLGNYVWQAEDDDSLSLIYEGD